MNSNNKTLHAIPTSIISGFLGAGKTSAILSLLQQKPAHERWAVLVNEFGEVGIDGALLQGQPSESNTLFIREVPGGCMCCSAGVPMKVALNQLLATAKPHRLLIEPTGLGHPKEVLATLSSEHFKDVLTINESITLVDARKLNDVRYTQHAIFNQQIDIADIIVGNKHDLYTEHDKSRLTAYIAERFEQMPKVIFSEFGQLDLSVLHNESSKNNACFSDSHTHHAPTQYVDINTLSFPQSGILTVQNNAQGYYSIGWRIAPQHIFNLQALKQWFSELQVTRVKAAFITQQGAFGFNLADDVLSINELKKCHESRIEIITAQPPLDWQQSFMQCLQK
ncbi:GTP-binding protein [Pseudoalteromonas sp. MMG010]|uniref:CobW family GTP-binding protein n=1 Tax=Pseudoalteromonas sp. MMG010 TaxID=2822685 RepID=UPI001B3A0A0F|nr:GTP-binding protein [Pseudoalteromonas sp. MMG010]MBQ4833610.1 GTP-binding protein [Pseudoalteromonas sp. MMG010]